MDAIKKRVSEKLGFAITRKFEGDDWVTRAEWTDGGHDYVSPQCKQLWDALLASERSREQLEKFINEALLATRNEAMDWANNQSGLKEQYQPLAYGAYLRGLDIFAENLRKLTLPALPSEED